MTGTAVAKHAGGRPRTHDRAAIMEDVCKRIAAGELVQDAAAAHGLEGETIRHWALDDEFYQTYARARDDQAHALAEQALRIADGTDEQGRQQLAAMVDSINGVDDDDKARVLSALAYTAVQRDRLRVDARKWLTSKIAPRLYSERSVSEVTGAGGGPLEIVVRVAREGRRITSG